MRRLLILTVLAALIVLALRMSSARAGQAMAQRCSEMCERMLSNMPDSFPPNRMMKDLEAIREELGHIVEELEDRQPQETE